MAINPINLITTARKRIARIAAIRASAFYLAPAATAIILGAILPLIGAITWEPRGYLLAPQMMSDTRVALVVSGMALIAVAVFRGWRAYSVSDDFIGAAVQIDQKIHAHEQVVTLATISEPETPEGPPSLRSPLFPLLWRNVMVALGSFNPEKEFALEIGEPLRRSSLPAAFIAIGLGVAMLALVRPPSPLQKTAQELRRLAAKIDDSAGADPEDQKLAQQIKHAADDLQNPKVPPEQKKKEIEEALNAVEKHETEAGETPGEIKGGKGSSAGSSSASSAGGTEGKGEGGQANGQSKGKGEGKGEGKGAAGTGANQSGKNNGKNTGGADTVELKNELAQAHAQVETEDQAANQTPDKPSPDQKNAQAPRVGNDPNLAGGNQKNESQKGSAPMPLPNGANTALNKTPKGQGKDQKGGTGGDTHLGEFPTAANYQRFLKPGENGAALNLKDARYVVFKIPSAATSGGGGKTVIDTERPTATTAYTNAPLAPTADTAPPDERQLVPPRYRDLIR